MATVTDHPPAPADPVPLCATCGQPRDRWVTDQLTGLPDRRGWDNGTSELLARRRCDRTALAIVDLDHFKRVNDRLGHLAGDDVLRAVAEALRASIRDSDLISRYGGDEFLALLPDTDADCALAVSERIQSAVHTLAVHSTTPSGRATLIAGQTVSIGLALHQSRNDLDIPDLIRRADNALYQAKRDGRNRIRLANPHHDPSPAARPTRRRWPFTRQESSHHRP